jgi:hypothetical protein
MPRMRASCILSALQNVWVTSFLPLRENTTALHAAVSMNHLDIVRVLLQFGADANAVAKCADATPTCILASYRQSLVVGTELLLCLWLFS